MNKKLDQSGSILISIIITVPFLILITALYMNLAVSGVTLSRKDRSQTHAQFASDAGVDYALQQINTDNTWTGTGGQLELQNEGGVRTTYEVSLADNSTESKTLTSIGRTYRPATSTTLTASKTIKADLRPVKSGTYSIVTGVGGLYMSNNSKILGGDVLVNGAIRMENTSQIGLTTNPVKVEVANQNCPNPPDATYPRLCASGESTQPITFTVNAHIYGTVKANNQTNGAQMSNPGLVAGSVAPGPLPVHDRAAQQAAATTTMTGAAASCSGSTVKSWPANVKIIGNVDINQQCKLTINGNVWITGTLTMRQTAEIRVSPLVGTTMPDIMVDGSMVSLRNGAIIYSNASGTGVRIINYWSRATCSPDCPDVTGTDLYASRDAVTIELENSASAPESILYSKWTTVNLANSGGVGALVGQTVRMTNSAAVTFGSSVTTGGIKFWVIDGYRRGN